MMRRMKIRAKPNFGTGGGGSSRSSTAKPVSQGAAAPKEAQKLNPAKDDEAATPVLATNSGKLSERSVVISSTKSEGKTTDASEVLHQEESSQSLSSSLLDTFPQSSLPDVQEKEIVNIAGDSEEHQQTVSGLVSTVSPPSKPIVNPQSAEFSTTSVPSPEAQQLQEESSDAVVTQEVSLSTTIIPQLTNDKTVDAVLTDSEMPSSEKSNEPPKETQQDFEAKSSVSMRRKKVKFKPMLGGSRKGGIMDKPKVRGANPGSNESNAKNESVEENIPNNNAIKSSHVKSESMKEETINPVTIQDKDDNGNTAISFMKPQTQEKGDLDVNIVSINPVTHQLVQTVDFVKKADTTPQPSSKVCPSLEEVPQVREVTSPDSVTATVSTMEPMDKVEADNPVIASQKPRPAGEKQGKKRIQKEVTEEIGSSDDSTGDKENVSSAITEVPIQEMVVRENRSLVTQKNKVKTPPSELNNKGLFGRLERKIKIEDSTERAAKQVFRKRKDEFRKKLSKGDLEPGKMTMFDLIYWNPVSNPMPGRTSSPKRNGRSSGRSDTDSIASETAEEQRVDDQGLDPTDSEHQSRPESPEVVEVRQSQEKPVEEDNVEEEENPKEDDTDANDEDSSAVKDVFAPRVKIGPNGEIMIDEQSIKIQTTAAKNRDEVLKKAVVVEESGDSSHYGKWSKRRRRSIEWTVKETALFYKALSTVGTDFSLMETLMKWRTRAELKTKFKKEERNNRELVDLALNDSTQFDMTVFEEESNYDPKEDRKAAKQAERAEAKRRRLEMKQQDRIKEMERKKLENKKNKVETMNRKKMLRRAYRSRAKKKKRDL